MHAASVNMNSFHPPRNVGCIVAYLSHRPPKRPSSSPVRPPLCGVCFHATLRSRGFSLASSSCLSSRAPFIVASREQHACRCFARRFFPVFAVCRRDSLGSIPSRSSFSIAESGSCVFIFPRGKISKGAVYT